MLRRPHPHLTAIVLGLACALAAAPVLAQVTAVLGVNDDRLQGTSPDGFLLLYTPDPVAPGSTISHWDTSAFPNLLMEPALNPDLPFLGLDVTPAMMQDIGWTAGTSNFNVVNLDDAGEGFTDPRPFAGAPGNPATTLGEARINLFNAVLAAWANTLESTVDVDVQVTWQPLPCQLGTGAVLGGAATTFIFQSPDFPQPGVWYPTALAEALAGEDLTGEDGDIFVIVNSEIDEECLGEGIGFYYGLDGQNPPTGIDVAPLVLHEVGHGLGFANFSDETDGALVGGDPSIYDLFVFDTLSGRTWAEMTDAERVASAVNFRRVVWNGPLATAAAATTLAPGVPELVVTAPAAVAGTYEIGLASFGPPIPAAGLAGEIACLEDAADLDPSDTILNGCSAAVNPEEVAGKIALVDRGLCNFTDKVLNAQAAGARAVVVVNNAGNTPVTLGGDDTLPIAIPAVSLGRRDGNLMRQAACGDDGAVFLHGGRFQITARWATANGQSGAGQARQLTDDSGYFFFFDENNVELVVKVLDACDREGFNNYWFFAGGLTNVEVTLHVVDTQSGESKTYLNPLGEAFQPIQDTNAFSTCP